MDIFYKKGAIFSECKMYRYRLWRIWDDKKPLVLFVMLNPSTADADVDDPTIRRCIGFAIAWGYGGIMVGNLFAYRSTDPKVLLKVTDPTGLENSTHLLDMKGLCEKVVCAWGNAPEIENKSLEGFKIDELHYLEITKALNPSHPLYLKSSLKPKPFTEFKGGREYQLFGNQSDQKKFIGNSVHPLIPEHWIIAMSKKVRELKKEAA